MRLPRSSARRSRVYAESCAVTNRCSQSRRALPRAVCETICRSRKLATPEIEGDQLAESEAFAPVRLAHPLAA
jgi:hypothetical protein